VVSTASLGLSQRENWDSILPWIGVRFPGIGIKTVSDHWENELSALKTTLLTMASHAEAAVNRAVKALLRRDDDLARQIKEDARVIDALEKQIDQTSLQLLTRQPTAAEVRMITMVMKIAHDLERVGDEATTISRRCLELSREPQLKQSADIPRIAALALQMLKGALDAFVNRDSARAQAVIPQDAKVDELHKSLHRELRLQMAAQPAVIEPCLNLMVVSKSLERIADHATNIAEEVVYLCEGQDIRHTGKTRGQKTEAPDPSAPGR
jgi:phosphate transport system protein